ncbi:hypothetical protein BD309DRAFT_962476 [Dichomitus squalens]|uniref:Uncharacterized protein n=1 Tax=Dichomitus squalens TaxID=114155 RepID=A0A4Q9PQY0_9APHY|nr:hypothetical protein BD309DRAFT_962476 [Dichomitus squalens]TBU56777.1 hypothetical protein BD310DRAFT_930747 [Dichomitus squalens]
MSMPQPNQRRGAWPWLGIVLRLQLIVSFVLLHLISSARADVNITLADTASQITFSPPACGLTLSSAGTGNCNSSWRIVTSNVSSSGTLTITSGPNNASGGLVPQLFLSVRALSLSIKTSNDSTAIVNISVSTSTPVVSVTSQINSSIQPIEIIGLVEDRLTTLALTFQPSPNQTTVLSIDSIVVTVSDQNTAPFVSPSIPASTTLPTVTPTIVIPSPSSSSHHGQSSGDVAAEALGAILGAVLVAAGAVLVLLLYRKRKRRRLARPDSSHPQDPPDP